MENYEKAIEFYENAVDSSNIYIKASALNNIASSLK